MRVCGVSNYVQKLKQHPLHHETARGCATARPLALWEARIRFRQAKNENCNPIYIDIPLHPALAATKVGNLTFPITEYGKPFTTNEFGVVRPICRIVQRTASAMRIAATYFPNCLIAN